MTHKAKNIQQRRTCITAILIGALGSTVPQAELQAHKYYDDRAGSTTPSVKWNRFTEPSENKVTLKPTPKPITTTKRECWYEQPRRDPKGTTGDPELDLRCG